MVTGRKVRLFSRRGFANPIALLLAAVLSLFGGHGAAQTSTQAAAVATVASSPLTMGSSTAGTTTIIATTTTVYEPIVERIVQVPATSNVTKSDLDTSLAALDGSLRQFVSQVVSSPYSGPSAPLSVTAFAPSQRIDNLSNVTISNSTIDSASLPDLAGSYLPVSGGTINGQLTVPYISATSTSATSTFSGGFNIGSSALVIYPTGRLVAAPSGNSWPSIASGGANWGPRDSWLYGVSAQGLIGVAGYSRASDQPAGAPTESIGAAGFVIADKASRSGWGLYSDVQFELGSYGYGEELAVKNKSGIDSTSTPYFATTGTYGIWLPAGGDSSYGGSPTNPNNTAIAIGHNSSTWNKGIVFYSDGLSTSSSGVSNAIELAKGMQIQWYTPSNTTGAIIRSDVDTPGAQHQILFQNNNVIFWNGINSRTFDIVHITTGGGGVNWLRVADASVTNAPTLSAQGSDTNVSINVTPKGTGNVAISSGNLGVSSSSPWARISIAGLAGDATPLFTISTSTTGATSTAFFIDKNGSVAIGTSSVSNVSYSTSYGLTIANPTGSQNYLEAIRNSNGSPDFVINAFGQTAIRGSVLGNASLSVSTAGASVPGIVVKGSTSQTADLQQWQNSSATVLAAINSSGGLAVGTTTTYSKLTVWGPDTASTSAFAVVNSASTTAFSVYDNGNATYAGSIFQSSDQRLKTNISSLDESASLAAIKELNPVAYNWVDPAKGSASQYGFIAQQVLPIFPDLVSTTSATSLTPDGTLTLNYVGLIAPAVKAIQALDSRIANVADVIAGFANSFTTKELTFDRATSNEVDTKTLCLGSTCVTEEQLKAMLAAAGQSGGSASSSPTNSTSTTEVPVIEVEGNNPAYVTVGDSYSDLGARITAPDADLNLGIDTFLNGAKVATVTLDTSSAGTSTIDYVVTDGNGITSTSTRTVVVQAPANTATSATSTVQ